MVISQGPLSGLCTSPTSTVGCRKICYLFGRVRYSLRGSGTDYKARGEGESGFEYESDGDQGEASAATPCAGLPGSFAGCCFTQTNTDCSSYKSTIDRGTPRSGQGCSRHAMEVRRQCSQGALTSVNNPPQQNRALEARKKKIRKNSESSIYTHI